MQTFWKWKQSCGYLTQPIVLSPSGRPGLRQALSPPVVLNLIHHQDSNFLVGLYRHAAAGRRNFSRLGPIIVPDWRAFAGGVTRWRLERLCTWSLYLVLVTCFLCNPTVEKCLLFFCGPHLTWQKNGPEACSYPRYQQSSLLSRRSSHHGHGHGLNLFAMCMKINPKF